MVTIGENERLEKSDRLAGKETSLEKIEEHQAKGTSIRSRQEWDINAEGPGKILLKCENIYGQQKYMSSIVKKNERGEITEKITGQQKVQEETAKYWEKMFADEGITTEEKDINEYLGAEAVAKAKKLTEPGLYWYYVLVLVLVISGDPRCLDGFSRKSACLPFDWTTAGLSCHGNCWLSSWQTSPYAVSCCSLSIPTFVWLLFPRGYSALR